MTDLSYLFSVGNSNDGPIGMCARVIASSREEALEILCDRLEEVNCCSELMEGEEYIEVYFNPNAITTADIDEEDDI